MKNENKITMRNFRTYLLNEAVKQSDEVEANRVKNMTTEELKKEYDSRIALNDEENFYNSL